jgi:hypothetical protein
VKNPKAKGSGFERKVAKQISEWITGGQDRTQLIRSVSSGGWGTRRESKDEAWRQVGDLAPNGPAGERFRQFFAVECKHYREIDWWAGFAGKEPIPYLWWRKLVTEAREASASLPAGLDFLRPLLIIKQNNRPQLVGFNDRLPLSPLTERPARRSILVPEEGVRFITFDEFISVPVEQWYKAWI